MDMSDRLHQNYHSSFHIATPENCRYINLVQYSCFMTDSVETANNQDNVYLRQGGNVFARLCLFVCVTKITQKVLKGSF